MAGYVYGVGAMGVQSQLPGPLSPAHPASPSHSADAQTFQIGTCRRLRAGMSVEHLSGGPDAPVSLCPPLGSGSPRPRSLRGLPWAAPAALGVLAEEARGQQRVQRILSSEGLACPKAWGRVRRGRLTVGEARVPGLGDSPPLTSQQAEVGSRLRARPQSRAPRQL